TGPHEALLLRGFHDPADATVEARAIFDRAMAALRRAVELADAVTTVSNPLREWLIDECAAPVSTAVVPCCVTDLEDDSPRQSTRSRWGAGDGPVVLYSGTVKAYQHLQDLVLPFVRAFLGED